MMRQINITKLLRIDLPRNEHYDIILRVVRQMGSELPHGVNNLRLQVILLEQVATDATDLTLGVSGQARGPLGDQLQPQARRLVHTRLQVLQQVREDLDDLAGGAHRVHGGYADAGADGADYLALEARRRVDVRVQVLDELLDDDRVLLLHVVHEDEEDVADELAVLPATRARRSFLGRANGKMSLPFILINGQCELPIRHWCLEKI